MLSSQGNRKGFSMPVCTAPVSQADTIAHGSPYPGVLKASAYAPEYEAHCPGNQVSAALDIQKGCTSNQNVQNIVGYLSHFTNFVAKLEKKRNT